MRITVFTPTYNRAYCLTRLFQSLKSQTFQDFEWVIVDDGSQDNTQAIIHEFIEEKPFFAIKYRKTENGGKHRAMNRGMDMAEGELLLIMDSDDWLREDALEWIDKIEKSIPEREKKFFAGVHGLKVHTDQSEIGHSFQGDICDCTYFERSARGISGDKAEVYYTYLMRKYPFPEYKGEKFCTECLVWDRFAADGLKIRHFNEGIYFCEYLEDGLTKSGNMLYARNPRQYGDYVHNIVVYRKQSWFYAAIKIYEYYLYEKRNMRFSEIVRNLGLPRTKVICAIAVQQIADVFRYFFNRKVTIKNTVLADMVEHT